MKHDKDGTTGCSLERGGRDDGGPRPWGRLRSRKRRRKIWSERERGTGIAEYHGRPMVP